MQVITNAIIYTGEAVLEGHCILIDKNKIIAIQQVLPDAAETIDLAGKNSLEKPPVMVSSTALSMRCQSTDSLSQVTIKEGARGSANEVCTDSGDVAIKVADDKAEEPISQKKNKR